jgi:RNA polymerase sigma-70 factor, ECF subfamily
VTEAPRLPEVEEGTERAPPIFRSIFESEFDFVYNTLRRFGVREADASDQAQEVFIVVHQLLPDYDATRPIRPWLVAIAYRVAARYRTLSRNVREVLDPPKSEPADSSPGAVQKVEQDEMRALTLEALDQIELSRRVVFVLAEIEEQPVPEIAETLGIPLNTAYSRLRLARDEFEKAVRRIWARAQKGAKP